MALRSDALHVLDDGDLERFLVGQLAHDHRHLVHAGPLRRAPAPLAGDDLEAAARASGRATIGCTRPFWRIESASSASSASRKSLRGLKGPARSWSIGEQALLALGRQARRRGARRLADQRREAAAEPTLLQGDHHRNSYVAWIV